jgi:hypothetical protein
VICEPADLSCRCPDGIKKQSGGSRRPQCGRGFISRGVLDTDRPAKIGLLLKILKALSSTAAMSKQFQIYALPADIERLIAQLREKLNVILISPTSPGPKPTWIESPIRQTSVLPSKQGTSVDCCLVANGLANIQFEHSPTRSTWRVTEESELISFSDCDFDGSVLVRGRFYCQTDFLKGQEIVKKRPEFLQWAESVFRVAKGSLQRSKELDAYVGSDAMAWEKGGGRFVSLALGRNLINASQQMQAGRRQKIGE